MSTVMGSPENYGDGRVAGSYKLVGAEQGTATPLEEGLVVGFSSDSEHVAINAGSPIGVTGKGHSNVSVAVAESGKKIWVQADSNIGTPVVGATVFVTAAGKVIDVDKTGDGATAVSHTATAATFASTEIREDGIVTNIRGKLYNDRKCACINLGGM